MDYFHRNFYLLLKCAVIMFLLHSNNVNNKYFVNADNWLQNCGNCKCMWVSGMKMADCKNTSLTVIPTNQSTELQVLDLTFNAIPEIQKEELADANLQNLHKLFMKYCTIQEVHKDALKGLEILIELDLSNNLIKILHPGTFSGLAKLRTLILNNNELEILEDRLFDNLKFLHKIELKHNRLYKIGLSTFLNVPLLSQIYLDANRLTVLRKDTFYNLERLTSLSLGLNPWNCSCELQQFRNYTIKQNLYTPPTSCHSPPHLSEKLWPDIPIEDFACRPKIVIPRDGALLEAAIDNVTLTCRIKGSPKPKVTWVYNKRHINAYDTRIHVRSSIEIGRRDGMEIFISELTITGVRTNDRGLYTCVAENRGGRDEADIRLEVPASVIDTGSIANGSPNLYLVIAIILASIALILTVMICLLCVYCKRMKRYKKNCTMSENGLVASKNDKSQNDSMLEGGSVIMEMQKSLLTEVNPVLKPPRRNDIESTGNSELEDGHDLKKTLLDETVFANKYSDTGSHDDETRSVALSETTPRSRQTFVDDGYGTNLPPDLLAFPARFPQSPSLQSSISNVQDGRLYGNTPLSSPVYQNGPTIYGGIVPPGFRTLQHPKTGRTIAIAANRSNSPFTAAPLIYPPVVLKQGYVTIPRKPRTPSWAPSVNSTLSDFPPTSPTSVLSQEFNEPVYDNLGLRTTASGNSILSLNKIGVNGSSKYSMKDRPLPATPTAANSKTYETIQETSPLVAPDNEPLYGGNKSNVANPLILGSKEKITKIPPLPPPKPKKKIPIMINDHSSTSQLFQDECEDGTEV